MPKSSVNFSAGCKNYVVQIIYVRTKCLYIRCVLGNVFIAYDIILCSTFENKLVTLICFSTIQTSMRMSNFNLAIIPIVELH